jgi:hypothetical protein
MEGDAMRFLRHLVLLLKEFGLFAWHNKAWWIIPIVLILLLLGGLIFVTQSAAPFLYTFF